MGLCQVPTLHVSAPPLLPRACARLPLRNASPASAPHAGHPTAAQPSAQFQRHGPMTPDQATAPCLPWARFGGEGPLTIVSSPHWARGTLPGLHPQSARHGVHWVDGRRASAKGSPRDPNASAGRCRLASGPYPRPPHLPQWGQLAPGHSAAP